MKKTSKIFTTLLLAGAVLVSCAGNQGGESGASVYCSPSFSSCSELPWIDVKPGVKRQILAYDDSLMMVRVAFDESLVGKILPLHTHVHTQASYVLSGKFEVHIGDDVQICGPGDSYVAGPGIPHEAFVIEPGEVLDTFNPVREEFLNQGEQVLTLPEVKVPERSSALFVLGAETPWKQLREDTFRQLLGYNDDIMMVSMRLGEARLNGELKLASHMHPQASYFISGKAEVHIGDKVKVCGPGDVYFVRPDEPHGLIYLEPCEIIDVFSPIREDFLK